LGFWGWITVSNSRNSNQKGGAKTKTVLALAILAALVFSAIKIVPLFVNNYDMQDSMQQEIRFVIDPQTGHTKSEDDIRQAIEHKAAELGIPATDNNVQVLDQSGHIQVSIDYTITVNLIVYQLQLHFHPQADNTSI
jgi:hypothetical protein